VLAPLPADTEVGRVEECCARARRAHCPVRGMLRPGETAHALRSGRAPARADAGAITSRGRVLAPLPADTEVGRVEECCARARRAHCPVPTLFEAAEPLLGRTPARSRHEAACSHRLPADTEVGRFEEGCARARRAHCPVPTLFEAAEPLLGRRRRDHVARPRARTVAGRHGGRPLRGRLRPGEACTLPRSHALRSGRAPARADAGAITSRGRVLAPLPADTEVGRFEEGCARPHAHATTPRTGAPRPTSPPTSHPPSAGLTTPPLARRIRARPRYGRRNRAASLSDQSYSKNSIGGLPPASSIAVRSGSAA
jgi:hypothetical protein